MTARQRTIDLPRLALSVRQPWPWAILYAGKDEDYAAAARKIKDTRNAPEATQDVIAGTPQQEISPCAADQHIGAIVAGEEIVSCIPCAIYISRAGELQIVFPCAQGVVGRSANRGGHDVCLIGQGVLALCQAKFCSRLLVSQRHAVMHVGRTVQKLGWRCWATTPASCA